MFCPISQIKENKHDRIKALGLFFLSPGWLPMRALPMPSLHFEMVAPNTETARENVSAAMGLDWGSVLLQPHRTVLRASLAAGKKEKKAPHFWKWLAVLQLKPILNSLSKRKKEPRNSLEVPLILVIYSSYVLYSPWTRASWTTVSRTNTGLGSRQPLVTISSTDQYLTLFCVCFCFKAQCLIYTFDSWILNSPPITF